MDITRRRVIGLTAFTLCAGAFGLPRIVLANAATDQRFVFIFLRGGMDGLYAVPPYGDPQFSTARTELAMGAPGTEGGVLKLDGMFGLHPAFANMYDLYQQRELAVFHAVASPYRDRSHFDAQDIVENGTTQPHLRESGWLNAALLAMPQTGQPLGIAIGNSLPLSLQGKADVTSWAPSGMHAPDVSMVARLQQLYASDPQLKAALESAQSAQQEMAASVHEDQGTQEQMAANGGKNSAKKAFVVFMQSAGKFLAQDNGPRIATIDLGGFDSHINQANAAGTLQQSYKLIDDGIVALKNQLGPVWNKTAVLMVTEFGRTVAMNGSHGTDHGTATAAFLAGGSVKGGRVLADWPGLAPSKLYQNRDLYPTTDLRSIEMAMLYDHLRIDAANLHKNIFPGSDTVRPMPGLFV